MQWSLVIIIRLVEFPTKRNQSFDWIFCIWHVLGIKIYPMFIEFFSCLPMSISPVAFALAKTVMNSSLLLSVEPNLCFFSIVIISSHWRLLENFLKLAFMQRKTKQKSFCLKCKWKKLFFRVLLLLLLLLLS